MPLSLVDFWKRLVASGLADTSTPRRWAAAYAREHNAKPPTDPQDLVNWLVNSERLLPFQASSLIEGSPDIVASDVGNRPTRIPKIRIAPLTQIEETAPKVFPRWLGVSRDGAGDTTAGDIGAAADTALRPNAIPGLVLQFNPSRITPEDGDRLRAIAANKAPGLPDYELLGLPGGPLGYRTVSMPIDETVDTVGLFASMPTGTVLADILTPSMRWPIRQIVSLILQIAQPLWQSAQTATLQMPVPSVDYVWAGNDSLGNDSQPMVWCDPLEQLTPGVFDFTTSMRQTESRILYTPPERLTEGKLPPIDQPSILYALGCLAYRLRTGNHAFAAAKDSQIRSRQIHFEPPELTKAVTDGAAGDPMFRVLAYALAKNPTQRFATIDQFTTALQATIPETETVEPVTLAASKPESKTPEQAKSKATVTPKKPVASEPKPKPTPQRQQSSASGKPTTHNTPAVSSQTRPKESPPTITKKIARPTNAPATAKTSPPKQPTPAPELVVSGTEASATASIESAANAAIESASVESEFAPTAASTPLAAPVNSLAPADSLAPTNSRAPATTSPAEPVATPAASDWIVPAPRRRPGRRRTTWLVLHSLWIPIFLLIVANALQDPNAPRPVVKRIRPAIPEVIPSVSGSRTPSPVPQTSPQQPPSAPNPNPLSGSSTRIEVVQDDEMLWAPPSALLAADATPPTPLASTILLPPGPAAIVTIDFPNLVATGLRDTFDPEIAPLLDSLQKRIVVPLDSVRLIAMAWFPGTDGVPKVAVAVHLKSPRPLEELTELWKVSEARGKGGVTLWASDEPNGWAYYPNPVVDPADGGVSDNTRADDGVRQVDAFAVGTIDQITDVAEVEGSRVLLPRQLEGLWKNAEATDAIALLTQPNFLIADARGWVTGTAPPLLDWIRSALIPECGGILFRVAASEDSATYVEARLSTAPGLDPSALRDKIRDRLTRAPDSADDFLVSREVDPSWRLLASRLPTMWAFASDQTRSMIYQRDVVFNAYLPPMALSQLTLGTLLASNTTAMTAVVDAGSSTKELTIDQMLDRPMSISFGQESLQFAVDNIVNEFSEDLPAGNKLPPVEIIGGDLQLMGITQNQQIRDFVKDKVPLRTVLTDLVRGANPDKTATGADDPKQALVWVVVGEGADLRILVTTREASKDKYTLPKEFVLK